MDNITIAHFARSIKDGDIIGFYGKNDSITQLISCVTFSKITHVGVVYNVNRHIDEQRLKSTVTFSLSEQCEYGGQMIECSITRIGRKYTINFGRSALSKSRALFYGQLQEKLTNKGMEEGLLDAHKQVGQVYGFVTLPLTLNFVLNFLPKKLQQYVTKNRKTLGRVCSTHCLYNGIANGSIDKDRIKDWYVTPNEFMRFSHLNIYKVVR